MKPIIIDSLHSYITNILSYRDGYENLVFRGQSDASWPVSCGAYRRIIAGRVNAGYSACCTSNYLKDYLIEKIEQTKKRITDLSLYPSDLDILADMQHYGAATNLIDFSKNSLVALYFALSNNLDRDGKVFCINLSRSTNTVHVPGNTIDMVLGNSKGQVYYFYPKHTTPRVPKQDSLFIFHDSGSIDNAIFDHVMVIPADYKRAILADLQSITDIKDESIYPDFHGYMQANNCNIPHSIPSEMEYNARIKECFDKKDYANALDLCHLLLDRDPKAYWANIRMAECYRNIKERDLNKALHYAEIAAGIEPDKHSPWNEQAVIYISLRSFKKAEEMLQVAGSKPMELAQHRLQKTNLAWMAICRGNYPKAEAILNELLAEKDTFSVLMNLGHISLFSQEKINGDALNFYTRAMKYAVNEDYYFTQLRFDFEDIDCNAKGLDDIINTLVEQLREHWESVVGVHTIA